jgi:hypothetical protein
MAGPIPAMTRIPSGPPLANSFDSVSKWDGRGELVSPRRRKMERDGNKRAKKSIRPRLPASARHENVPTA